MSVLNSVLIPKHVWKALNVVIVLVETEKYWRVLINRDDSYVERLLNKKDFALSL